MPDLLRRLLGVCAFDFGLLYGLGRFSHSVSVLATVFEAGQGLGPSCRIAFVTNIRCMRNDLELRHVYGEARD